MKFGSICRKIPQKMEAVAPEEIPRKIPGMKFGSNPEFLQIDPLRIILFRISYHLRINGSRSPHQIQGNYVEDEVEQLIHVALLCTLSYLMEHPKMSEVVSMLEGDGLAERWEEWQNEEMFQQEFVNIYHQNNDFNNLPDSTPNLPPEELSGPR